uniref:C2H2-type domain-containing protein n=1 Tax=Homalodisca liturata TaxID=320908 RepID=A0A1B6IEN9_9HEMI
MFSGSTGLSSEQQNLQILIIENKPCISRLTPAIDLDSEIDPLQFCKVENEINEDEQNYGCPDLEPYSFSPSISSRVSDTLIHKGLQTFECTLCGKYFKKRCHLMRHKLVHAGVKPYTCDVCAKSFSEKSDLVKHERIHMGLLPYKCTTCEKCFSQKCNLLRHKRVHSGENPFHCDYCGVGFTKKRYLGFHLRECACIKP